MSPLWRSLAELLITRTRCIHYRHYTFTKAIVNLTAVAMWFLKELAYLIWIACSVQKDRMRYHITCELSRNSSVKASRRKGVIWNRTVHQCNTYRAIPLSSTDHRPGVTRHTVQIHNWKRFLNAHPKAVCRLPSRI